MQIDQTSNSYYYLFFIFCTYSSNLIRATIILSNRTMISSTTSRCKSRFFLVVFALQWLFLCLASATGTTTTTTTTASHSSAATAASNNLINSLTGVCKLEDLALGSCTLSDFCATLNQEQEEQETGIRYECKGDDYQSEWTVTSVHPETCHPPGLIMSFSSYPYNATRWDDETALTSGHSCSIRQETHTFVQDRMIKASRTVFYTKPLIQSGRLDWTAPVHVCQPREHQHYTQYARDVAFCIDTCLAFQVNQQPCKEGCVDCGPGNTPYDCSNIDPGLIPSCYSFADFKGDFLRYFQKVNTGDTEYQISVQTEEEYNGNTDATTPFFRPGVDPCFTEEQPLSCHSNVHGSRQRKRNLFGFSSPVTEEEAEVVSACNDIEVFFLSGIQFSYDLHSKAFESLGTDSKWCPLVRQHYASCYWCAPEMLEHNDDQYCATLETFCEEEPDVIDDTVNATETCNDVSYWLDYFNIYPNTIDLCYRAKQSLYKGTCDNVCGRDREALRSPFRPSRRTSITSQTEADLQDGVYLGADTNAKKKTLVWLTRTSAILSFIGGCYILYDVLFHKDSRAKVYYQLLAAMAIFDLCTASAWSLATNPLPKLEAGYIYGANGDDGGIGCAAQGFFVQLGFTSVFYNVSLSAYYVLVIVYGWRESDLRRIRLWLHIPPLLIGSGLAFGGLPLYDWIEYGCMMPIHKRWSSLVFGVIPLGLSIFCITASMIWIYVVVRQTAKRTRDWSLTGSRSLESQVFWQALLYAMSFYITWPILFAVYLWSIDVRFDSFALSCIIAFVAPLQGCTDFLVYVRPKATKILAPRMSGLMRRSTRLLQAVGGSASRSRPFSASTNSSNTNTNASSKNNNLGSNNNKRRQHNVDDSNEWLREELRDLDPSVAIANRSTEDSIAIDSNNDAALALPSVAHSTDDDEENSDLQTTCKNGDIES